MNRTAAASRSGLADGVVAALFDLDGTLVESEHLAVEALLAAVSHHGHSLSREAVMLRPGAHFATLLVDELRIGMD